MSTIKADAIEAATGTNTDLDLAGKGTGVPDIASGFKVGGTAGVPVNNLRTGTDGELITWDASGDPATVAVGTATHVLTSNGAGAAPTFQAAAAGGAWTYIGSTDVTAAATVTITGINFSTYDIHVLTIANIKAATNSNTLEMQVGDSGGVHTGSDYTNVIEANGGQSNTTWTGENNLAQDHFPLTRGNKWSSDMGYNAVFFLRGSTADTSLNFWYHGTQMSMGVTINRPVGGVSAGALYASQEVDRIQLAPTTGDFSAQGTLRLYGINNS